MKVKRLIVESLIGGLLGYLILHPASMYIQYHYIQSHHESSSLNSRLQFALKAFSLDCLEMALFFIFIGIIIGIIHSYYTKKIISITSNIEVLEGLLPICAECKKIRDESKTEKNNGKWIPVERYISKRSKTNFTHGICPDCAKKQLEEINKL